MRPCPASIREAPTRLRRRLSRGLPRRALLPDEVRRATSERDGCSRFDPVEHLGRRWPCHLTFEDLLDEVGEGLPTGLRTLHQLAMQTVRDVPDLDHLGHV